MICHELVKGIEVSNAPESSHSCVGCIYWKAHQAPIPNKSTSRSSAQLEIVHSDVLGPVDIPSLSGSRYFDTFIDDFSKWTTIFTMRKRRVALNALRSYQKYAETHTGNKLQHLQALKCTSGRNILTFLRTDGGGEYLSSKFRAFLFAHCIHSQL